MIQANKKLRFQLLKPPVIAFLVLAGLAILLSYHKIPPRYSQALLGDISSRNKCTTFDTDNIQSCMRQEWYSATSYWEAVGGGGGDTKKVNPGDGCKKAFKDKQQRNDCLNDTDQKNKLDELLKQAYSGDYEIYKTSSGDFLVNKKIIQQYRNGEVNIKVVTKDGTSHLEVTGKPVLRDSQGKALTDQSGSLYVLKQGSGCAFTQTDADKLKCQQDSTLYDMLAADQINKKSNDYKLWSGTDGKTYLVNKQNYEALQANKASISLENGVSKVVLKEPTTSGQKTSDANSNAVEVKTDKPLKDRALEKSKEVVKDEAKSLCDKLGFFGALVCRKGVDKVSGSSKSDSSKKNDSNNKQINTAGCATVYDPAVDTKDYNKCIKDSKKAAKTSLVKEGLDALQSKAADGVTVSFRDGCSIRYYNDASLYKNCLSSPNKQNIDEQERKKIEREYDLQSGKLDTACKSKPARVGIFAIPIFGVAAGAVYNGVCAITGN